MKRQKVTYKLGDTIVISNGTKETKAKVFALITNTNTKEKYLSIKLGGSLYNIYTGMSDDKISWIVNK